MSKFLRALLIAAAATGAVALLLKALDLKNLEASASARSNALDLDPDDLSEDEVDALMQELASQLGL